MGVPTTVALALAGMLAEMLGPKARCDEKLYKLLSDSIPFNSFDVIDPGIAANVADLGCWHV